tara:strand:+ start:285 stop:530 length:246 start_codon:yes stop_codon:yes gene_type:complete
MKIRDFNLEEYIESKTYKFRQRIRNKAIQRAENNLIRYGRLQTDLTPDEWENLVCEEEDVIWDNYKKGSLTTIIAAAFWLP